jgi:hypothetical protein
MRVNKVPDMLHVSVDLSHASPNMLLDGRYIAFTHNMLHALRICISTVV